jgi:RHS repeat-associated protein
LFNGNISAITTTLTDATETSVASMARAFRYDQLNRIKSSDAFYATNLVADNDWTSASHTNDYYEAFAYDYNGNITHVDRNGVNSVMQVMDDLDYFYSYMNSTPVYNNRLEYVTENYSAADASYGIDIDGNQTAGNYGYEENGNLYSDLSEQIDHIDWTPQGKVWKVNRTSGSTKADLEFVYDAMGNRIEKIVKPRPSGTATNQVDWTHTYYRRDASGNVLAIYSRTFEASGGGFVDHYAPIEQHIYGGSRIGIRNDLTAPSSNTFSSSSYGTGDYDLGYFNISSYSTVTPVLHDLSVVTEYDRVLGQKEYELSNHLGNVYAVITDKKIGHASTQYANEVAYYTADVISATDYYAFGASMPQRTFQSDDYRYGFNGVEHETEYDDGVYSTDFRFVDTRLGRWMSTDPVVKEWESPYAAYSNNPIYLIDPSGADPSDPDGDPTPCGPVEPVYTSYDPSVCDKSPGSGPDPVVNIMVFPNIRDNNMQKMYDSYENDPKRGSSFIIIEASNMDELNNKLRAINEYRQIGILYLVSHGYPIDNWFAVGDDSKLENQYTLDRLLVDPKAQAQFQTLGSFLTPGRSNLVFISCGAGSPDDQSTHAQGESMLSTIADLIKAPVYGSQSWIPFNVPLYAGTGSTRTYEFAMYDSTDPYYIQSNGSAIVNPTIANAGYWTVAYPKTAITGVPQVHQVNAIYIMESGKFGISCRTWQSYPQNIEKRNSMLSNAVSK